MLHFRMDIEDMKTTLELQNIEPTEIFQKVSNLNDAKILQKCQTSWDLLINGKYTQSACISQVLLDLTWQEINIGHWKDVDINWRYLYSFVSLIKALCIFALNDINRAVKICDMGLLLGAPIFENILAKLVSKFNTILQQKVQSDISSRNDEGNATTISHVRKVSNQEDNTYNVTKRVKTYHLPVIDCSNSIQRIDYPSLITFQNEYMKKEKPVIIRNSINHWPALSNHKWTLDYIKSTAGTRTVPVEIGEKYTSENWTQKLITVTEFIDKYILCGKEKGYLAQHELFEQVPELKNDICVPDYCCLSEAEDENVMINAWFGPEGTISPMHYDPYHNLLTQVIGGKYVRLYDKKYSEELYPHEGLLSNTSQVDVDTWDEESFPKFGAVPFVECILEAGEMLYMPPKWWHYIRSVSTSFSVSFWWE